MTPWMASCRLPTGKTISSMGLHQGGGSGVGVGCGVGTGVAAGIGPPIGPGVLTGDGPSACTAQGATASSTRTATPARGRMRLASLFNCTLHKCVQAASAPICRHLAGLHLFHY